VKERFRQFAENSSDVFWILNAHTQRLEYLNPIYEKMFGETREPIMRNVERWTELIHPEDRERGADMLSRLLAGESVTVEYRIIRPNDGEIRWIRDSGFPIRNDDGTINRVAGVLQDVTNDRQRTEALRESEERFRAVANLVPDLIWSTDGSGLADWFNQRWIDYTGQNHRSFRRRWLANGNASGRSAGGHAQVQGGDRRG
jgi:PAS domain S-box-containing protein